MEPDFNFMAGASWYNLGDDTKALESLLRAKSGYDNQHYYHYLLGNLFMKRARYDEAVQEYAIATDLSGKEPTYFYNLACAYARKGDAYSAAKWLKKAIELDPSLRGDALKEKDFDSIRDTNYFKDAIKELLQK
jgi:tetratricopeptide (TPR) repeat protein